MWLCRDLTGEISFSSCYSCPLVVSSTTHRPKIATPCTERNRIVRVGSADEMNSFIMKKKKEIAEKRDAQKRAKAALEGKTSGDEL